LLKKRLYVIIGCLSIMILILASCNPTSTSTSATSTTSVITTTTKPPTTTTTPSDKPQYGGTLTLLSGTNWQVFSPGAGRPGGPPMMWEQVTNADRTRGPAGSNLVDYGNGPTSMEDVVGCLAEKWSTPDPNTWVLDIRQGVHFAEIPNNAGSALVGGREMTADDVIASLEANRDQPKSWSKNAEPALHSNMTIEKTGQWQVTVHLPVNPSTAYLWLMGGGGSGFIWPKEWIPKYFENNNWNVQVGTGSYYITDFVDNSVLTMERNNNYWDTNPVGLGKGDQLPYIDNIKFLIVQDSSTQLSALRTGKAEMVATAGTATGFDRDDAQSLLNTNSNIKTYKYLAYPYQVGMRRDKTDLPYDDIRVRKALMMATDMKTIANDLYGGEAEILASPSSPLFPTCYTPLDKLPADTQELYQYNPDKAKQLLADAGYADGFQASMVVSSALSSGTDMAETLKAMWAKVNVTLDIQIKETGAFSTIWTTRSYDNLMLTQNCGGDNALFVRYSFGYFRGQNSYNISYVNDPIGSDPTIETAFQEECKYINADFAKCDQLHKDANVYILSQAFLIPTPAPYQYRMWQPWLKGFNGEGASKHWIQYVWLDQNLKSSISK
jgi:peptide/nickel transport system substrate-binding protein